MTPASAPVRGLAAAVFGGAAVLFAFAWALVPEVGTGIDGVHDGLYSLLWIGGSGVPSAALVGALAGPRVVARVSSAVGGLAAGAAVTAGAFVLGIALVAAVAGVRPGGLLGMSAFAGPGAFDVGPGLVLQAAVRDGLAGLLLPALPFGAAAGAALVRLTRRRAAHAHV